ncbi:MAG: GerMN domain-containing protein [Firmicutes bacterium]|nr:GerMN domain-containing protein [Bacillota bacterium]
MKRLLAIVLPLCLLASLCACAAQETELSDPVSFYFLRADVSYSEAGEVFTPVEVSATGHTGDIAYLLGEYLALEPGEGVKSPFPAQLQLLSLEIGEEGVSITVSDELAACTGIARSLACACLTLTAAELTELDTVTIRTPGSEQAEAIEITMSLSSLELSDKAIAQEDSE